MDEIEKFNTPLGVELLPDVFLEQYGRVKHALEVIDENDTPHTDVNSAELKHAQIMAMAVRGMSKRVIAENLKCSIRSVESHVYSEQGQAALQNALELTNIAITTTLPLLMNEALVALEDVIKGGDTKKLQAVDRVFSLHSRVERMAKLEAPIITKTQSANLQHTQ